ncbi:MAG: sulfurase [bacterium]
MPVLKRTQFTATITYLGAVRSKEGPVWSGPEQEVFAGFEGIAGEVHTGMTAPSCVRMTTQYPEGTEVRNTRQFSVLSAEEMAEIAVKMGLDSLSPSLLGATMVLSGIPDFSHIPPGSRLQGSSGATLVVNLNNRPCVFPGKGIEAAHPGFGAAFKPAAKGLRGVVAWVEREGSFKLGDTVRLHIPDQRPWALLDEVLGLEAAEVL